MNKEEYITPIMEVVDLSIENTIATGSGEGIEWD